MCIQGWGSQALREAENAPEEDHSDCLVVFYRFYPINFHWPWRDHYGREVPYGTGRKAPEAPTSSPGIASRKGPISYNKIVGAIFWWWSCRNWTSQVTELRLIQLIRPSSYCRYFQIYGLLREKKTFKNNPKTTLESSWAQTTRLLSNWHKQTCILLAKMCYMWRFLFRVTTMILRGYGVLKSMFGNPHYFCTNLINWMNE